MKAQNRPLSLVDIFTNLHSSISKTIIQKVLNEFVEKKELVCKAYGKQSVYVYSQVNTFLKFLEQS